MVPRTPVWDIGQAKQKCVFNQTQNAQIQIHTTHAQSLIKAFAFQWYIPYCSIILL